MDILNDRTTFEGNAKKAAQLLKTLAHGERLMILCQLVHSEHNVGELLKHTTLSQSAFSQHLSILKKANLVKTRKESQIVYYSLADKKALRVLEVLHELYCR